MYRKLFVLVCLAFASLVTAASADLFISGELVLCTDTDFDSLTDSKTSATNQKSCWKNVVADQEMTAALQRHLNKNNNFVNLEELEQKDTSPVPVKPLRVVDVSQCGKISREVEADQARKLARQLVPNLSATSLTPAPTNVDGVCEPVILVCDINHDDIVNAKDFAYFMDNWRSENATWEQGDFNGDGKVNEEDFEILLSEWQKRACPLVPEPSTFCLLIGSMLFGLYGLRRRKSKLA